MFPEGRGEWSRVRPAGIAESGLSGQKSPGAHHSGAEVRETGGKEFIEKGVPETLTIARDVEIAATSTPTEATDFHSARDYFGATLTLSIRVGCQGRLTESDPPMRTPRIVAVVRVSSSPPASLSDLTLRLAVPLTCARAASRSTFRSKSL
jgi:hypothetical protein